MNTPPSPAPACLHRYRPRALPPDEPLEKDEPARLGPYTIVGRIGAGAMGIVCGGLDEHGQRVAVKTVHVKFARKRSHRDAFTREVDMPARARGEHRAPREGTPRPRLVRDRAGLEHHVRGDDGGHRSSPRRTWRTTRCTAATPLCRGISSTRGVCEQAAPHSFGEGRSLHLNGCKEVEPVGQFSHTDSVEYEIGPQYSIRFVEVE